jgi:hypothetical protein
MAIAAKRWLSKERDRVKNSENLAPFGAGKISAENLYTENLQHQDYV